MTIICASNRNIDNEKYERAITMLNETLITLANAGVTGIPGNYLDRYPICTLAAIDCILHSSVADADSCTITLKCYMQDKEE